MRNYYMEMMEIYDRLCDEESRILFDSRVSYMVNRYIVMKDLDASRNVFLKTIDKLYAKDEWRVPEVEKKITDIKPEGIIIFGCGCDGQRTYKLLTQCKEYDVSYFCDNYKRGECVGVKILSLEEMLENCKKYLVIIGSRKYGKEMFIELVERGFPIDNILLPEYGLIRAIRGRQYFDVFSPQRGEVFIDAGTYDGETILEFSRWSEGDYRKIYGFEPMTDMCERTKQTVEYNDIKSVNILNYAAWNKKEKLFFVEDKMSSCQSDKGGIVVQGVDIDSVVGDEKVTFIKMDIEGSEFKALEGAQNTIIRHRPRLAICIYHKPMDIIDIPLYLLKLIPEYKFYIRHYESNFWGEEVLYAVL